MAVLDVLLGVVPGATGVGQVVRHQLAGEDDGGEEGAERPPVDAEPDDDRGEHGEERRGGELTQRRRGADVDDRAVVGLLLALHDLAVGELAADLLHHDTGGATHGADGQGGEEERHGATDQQTDEDLRVGHVDLHPQVVEHAALDVLGGLGQFVGRQQFVGRGLDERAEQGHGGDDGRADGEALGDGLGRVADGVEADHDPLGLAVELARHLGDAGGVVRHRAEGVLGHDHAGGGEHAHAAQRDQVERELQVAAAQAERDADGESDGDDGVHRRLEARRGAGEHDGGGAGAGRGGDLLDRREVGAGVVLGQAADALGEDQADGDGGEALPAGVLVIVADVDEAHDERADDGEHTGHEEATVDRLEGVGLAFLRLHGEEADDRRDHADGASGDQVRPSSLDHDS